MVEVGTASAAFTVHLLQAVPQAQVTWAMWAVVRGFRAIGRFILYKNMSS